MEKALKFLKQIRDMDIDDFLELEDNYLENKLAEAISELEEAMRKPTCETFDKGASSTNYPPKTIFAFGNYYTLKDTQC